MTAPELDAEQEVDFGRYGRRIGRRWWIVVAATAIGVLVGWLFSLGGGDVYRATATVYLGQPLSPTGSAQIQSLATNPSVVPEIVRSQEVVRGVADEVGIEPGKLRQGISTRTVAGSVARSGQTPLVEISVRGPGRRESTEAANRLAEIAVERVSGSYTTEKIATLADQLEAQDRELEQLESRISELQGAAQSPELSSTEKLIVNGLVTDAEIRRGQLIEDRTATQQLLTLARNVEASRVVTEARATQVAARSRRNSLVVGGVIGLLAGIVLALAIPARSRAAEG
jgi:capsular polysaccharide biosynthesis protein